MSPPLPTTRLHFPQARTNLIPRPRLLEKLMALESPGHRLGLISAPAGFGKTTMVLQWLAQRQACPACWVSLDARDSQPAAFFIHLISALQMIFLGAGRPALDLLSLPGVSLEEVVTLLVNDLAEAGSSFALILDDFHHITDPLILQALDLLPDVQPPQMRLLLLTREDPALQLALSLQHSPDVDGFIHAFSCSNRFILDYLMEGCSRSPRSTSLVCTAP